LPLAKANRGPLHQPITRVPSIRRGSVRGSLGRCVFRQNGRGSSRDARSSWHCWLVHMARKQGGTDTDGGCVCWAGCVASTLLAGLPGRLKCHSCCWSMPRPIQRKARWSRKAWLAAGGRGVAPLIFSSTGRSHPTAVVSFLYEHLGVVSRYQRYDLRALVQSGQWPQPRRGSHFSVRRGQRSRVKPTELAGIRWCTWWEPLQIPIHQPRNTTFELGILTSCPRKYVPEPYSWSSGSARARHPLWIMQQALRNNWGSLLENWVSFALMLSKHQEEL
jgi:hypothetical protein